MKPIKYISHPHIDLAKWDACILNASNGNIYSTSSWLNSWCHWDALVMGDYEMVMPLPIKQIGFVKLSRQPLFTQQLGVFGSTLNNNIVTDFLSKIPLGFFGKIYRLHLYLNVGNPMEAVPLKFKASQRITHHLTLDEGNKGYNENTRRNIKKALAAGLIAKKETLPGGGQAESPEAILDFLVTNSEKIEQVKSHHWHQYRQAIQTQWKLGNVQAYETLDKEGNRQAAALFLVYKDVAVYSLGASSPTGRDNGAMHLLMDTFICHNLSRLNGNERLAGTPTVDGNKGQSTNPLPSERGRGEATQALVGLPTNKPTSIKTLDFAGSMIPSIARFFKGWGAEEVYYTEIGR